MSRNGELAMTALLYLLPATVTALAAIGGSVTSRSKHRREWMAALCWIALPSLLVGLLGFVTHAPDVSGSRALEGAGIAAVASLFALTLYYIAGRFIGPLLALFAFWLVSLVPLYYVWFLAGIAVATFTQCTPGQYECPV
jgi:hypothetical protein